ncbi:MAG: hypothetical protein R2813_07440 [Flavobacteriales bacterium]
MRTMNSQNANRAKLVALFSLIVVLNFQSCKKYEDGPLVSLKSPEKRIVKKWDLDDVDGNLPIEDLFDQVDVDAKITDWDITFDFDDDGDFTMRASYTMEYTYMVDNNSYTYPYTFDMRIDGDWDFNSKKDEINIDFNASDYDDYADYRNRDYKILRLADDEMILEAENGAEWTFND